MVAGPPRRWENAWRRRWAARFLRSRQRHPPPDRHRISRPRFARRGASPLQTASSEGPTMSLESLQDLYLEQLRDLHSAERQILQALPKMIKHTKHADLRQGFER